MAIFPKASAFRKTSGWMKITLKSMEKADGSMSRKLMVLPSNPISRLSRPCPMRSQVSSPVANRLASTRPVDNRIASGAWKIKVDPSKAPIATKSRATKEIALQDVIGWQTIQNIIQGWALALLDPVFLCFSLFFFVRALSAQQTSRIRMMSLGARDVWLDGSVMVSHISSAYLFVLGSHKQLRSKSIARLSAPLQYPSELTATIT